MVGMQADQVSGLGGFVVDVIGNIGVLGVGALVALETVFPPLPSEVILPFAGFSAARGDIDPFAAWAAATLGALLGAFVLYGVGAAVGAERAHQLAGRRWFLLYSQADLRRGERFFDRHGSKVILLGRFIPFVRSVVSVPAGIARMPLGRFAALTALGSGIWNAAFIWVGFTLGERWDQVGQYLRPVGWAVGVVLVGALVALAVRRHRFRRRRAAAGGPQA
jgi:membrane protein DedA with SNARE-associated domain